MSLVVVVHRETIGRRIAEQRETLGLSQEALAERIGVRGQTVSRWERGTNLGRLHNLEQVASALEITVADLMADLDADPTAGPLDELDPAPVYVTELREQLDRIEAALDELVAEREAAVEAEAAAQESEQAKPQRAGRQQRATGS